MKLKILAITVILMLLLGSLARGQSQATADGPIMPTLSPGEIKRFTAQDATRTDGNLLANGDMNLGFYFRPTNHFVAWPWFEWWGNYTTIPEFIDGGHPHHNECYPIPAVGKTCSDYENHSQGYIRYGTPYIAGIYQAVNNVTPCTLYTFEVYNRNDPGNYHPKIGMDVSGWILTRLGSSKPHNCPPDGASICPDPYIAQFPATMIWSPESTHPGYTWASLSLTAEAINTSVSVWTSAAPDYTGSLSTYWDYASLVQTPFPEGKLPAPASWTPSGFIQNLTTQWLLDKVLITWTTPEPASTQVWYTFTPGDEPVYELATPLDTTPTTWHQVIIEGLQHGGDTLRFAALSRRPQGISCTTEVFTQTFVAPERVPAPASWTPAPLIQNLTLTPGPTQIQLTWETTLSTTTQVWYKVLPAPTPPPSSTLLLGNSVYLPLVAHIRYDFPAHTPLSLTLQTRHSAVISNLKAGESVRLVVVAGYVEADYTLTTLASEIRHVSPYPAPQ